jgi:phosphate transport system substrate-binding protein
VKITTLVSAAALAVAGVVAGGQAYAQEQIQIVGSSTVFPFTTAVAERFGQKTQFPTPIVESTGTGGGMKLFCSGVGSDTPDFTGASRRMKSSEFESCQANGVTPVEIKIGFDGIVVANAVAGEKYAVTREQLFLALAKQIPVDGALVDNPNTNWSDIDPALPNAAIEVLGPPPTSGTRDAFVELVMEEGCDGIEGAADLGLEGKACHAIREDGVYVEAGENDNLIVQKLDANPAALGIFGFSFLDQNSDKVQGATINGVEPTFDNIASGDYPVSRSMFVYAKKEHAGVIPGLEEFIAEYTSEDAFGDDGYLVEKGLIPLPEGDRAQVAEAAANLTALEL